MPKSAWKLDTGQEVPIESSDITGWEREGADNMIVKLLTKQGNYRVVFPVDKISSRLDDMDANKPRRPS